MNFLKKTIACVMVLVFVMSAGIFCMENVESKYDIQKNVQSKCKIALQLNHLLGENGFFAENNQVDKVLRDILIITKKREAFEQDIDVKSNWVRLSVWFIVLTVDSRNSEGFLSGGAENVSKIEGVLLETLATFYKIESAPSERLQKLGGGVTEKDRIQFLLSNCFGVLCEHVSTLFSEKSNSDMLKVYKRLYFFRTLLEHPGLKGYLTDQKTFHTEKTKNYDYFYLPNIRGMLKKVESKTFSKSEDFIKFVREFLAIDDGKDSLELEKEDLFVLIFKVGFLFNIYQNAFESINKEGISAEEKNFLASFLSHMIKIQNCIESKLSDKEVFRAFFNSVLLVAIKKQLFDDEFDLVSRGELQAREKTISFGKNIQMMLLLLVKKNLLECQKYARTKRDIFMVGAFGLTTLGLASGIAFASVFPPTVIASVVLAGAVSGALGGSATILSSLTGGKTWDSVKNLLAKSAEAQAIEDVKVEFLNYANDFIQDNSGVVGPLTLEKLKTGIKVFTARKSAISKVTPDKISKKITEMSIVSTELGEKSSVDQSETIDSLNESINELKNRMTKLEATVEEMKKLQSGL